MDASNSSNEQVVDWMNHFTTGEDGVTRLNTDSVPDLETMRRIAEGLATDLVASRIRTDNLERRLVSTIANGDEALNNLRNQVNHLAGERDRLRNDIGVAQDRTAAAQQQIGGLLVQVQELRDAQASQAPVSPPVSRSVTPPTVEVEATGSGDKVLLKTLEKNLRKYGGERKAPIIRSWIDRMDTYWRAANLSDDMAVLVAGSYLEGAAEVWWFQNRDTLKTFADFRQALTAAFSPADHVARARRKLYSLRQGRMSVSEFYTKFMELVLEITTLTEEEKLQLWMDGLNVEVSNGMRNMSVLTNTPLTFETATRIAVNTDDTSIGSRRFNPNPTSAAGPSQANPTVPDMMEIDAMSLTEAARAGQLTAAQHQFLRDHNGCFNCGKLNADHISRTCPERRNNGGGRGGGNGGRGGHGGGRGGRGGGRGGYGGRVNGIDVEVNAGADGNAGNVGAGAGQEGNGNGQ